MLCLLVVGKDHAIGREIALKLEHRDGGMALEDEISCYQSFSDLPGFPEVYWSGWKDDYTIMAFELLGPSLEDLFAYCGHRFTLKTTLMVMDQLLARVKDVHAKGFIHRDVKPANFLMGTGSKGNVIYVTDFGISREYVKGDGDEPEDSLLSRPRVVGTTRFASIRAHMGQVQTRKDDLEALGYMMVYFLRGKLPWQGLKARDTDEKDRLVMEKKKDLAPEELCLGLPPEVSEYITIVKSLPGGQRPPYRQLRKLLRGLAEREGVEYDCVFDWTERLYLQQEMYRSTAHSALP